MLLLRIGVVMWVLSVLTGWALCVYIGGLFPLLLSIGSYIVLTALALWLTAPMRKRVRERKRKSEVDRGLRLDAEIEAAASLARTLQEARAAQVDHLDEVLPPTSPMAAPLGQEAEEAAIANTQHWQSHHGATTAGSSWNAALPAAGYIGMHGSSAHFNPLAAPAAPTTWHPYPSGFVPGTYHGASWDAGGTSRMVSEIELQVRGAQAEPGTAAAFSSSGQSLGTMSLPGAI
jgi:hypothetical protein